MVEHTATLTVPPPRIIRRSCVTLTVVIPAFNEQKRLPEWLGKLREFLGSHYSGRFEIIIVDDGSQHALEPWLRQLGLCFPEVLVIRHSVNRGKGAAVRTGVRCSLGERILVCDADGATALEEILRLDAAVVEGCDVACGSRRSGSALRTPFRRTIAALFSFAVRIFTGLPVTDTQCGFKLFQGDVARDLFENIREDGYLYDVELLLLAHERGIPIREIEIEWREMPGSKVRPVRDGWRMLWGLVGLRKRMSGGCSVPVRKAA